jgi:hypothetical protein
MPKAVARLLAAAVLAVPLAACGSGPPAQLALVHADVFDSRTGAVLPDRTVIVRDGRIAALTPSTAEPPAAARVIDARGRLLTPGLIDGHHHTAMVLADSITATGGPIANLSMEPDSITAYRHRWARAYLPYGVTSVRAAGDDERDLPMLTAWMHPVPWAPDFYPCGGAMVSHEEGRVPYPGHVEVASPEAAAAKVRQYHDLGFRFVKLYWRLREPEFTAAIRQAQALGMIPFAHIDFNVFSISKALDLGLRDVEHAYPLIKDVMTPEEQGRVWRTEIKPLTGGSRDGLFFAQTMGYFAHLGPDDPRMNALIERLARTGTSVTPTLHVFGRLYGFTYFTLPPAGSFDDLSGYSDTLMAQGRRGYRVMAGYVKTMFDDGVRLNLGTDSAEPGKSALSEMLCLHGAGIPMPAVLRIATRNTAETLAIQDSVGTIAPGMKADLVLFDRSPLEDPQNLLSPKTVIKDGVVEAEPATRR